MILSASGWRKVFAASGCQEDAQPQLTRNDTGLAVIMAETFFYYVSRTVQKNVPSVVVGMDTRPTGPAIADAIIRVLCTLGADVHFTSCIAAPEIMCFAKGRFDGFIYISASHNPIGHNGVKFGLSDGGVISGAQAAVLIQDFKQRCDAASDDVVPSYFDTCPQERYEAVMNNAAACKSKAADCYRLFTRCVVTGSDKQKEQDDVFASITAGVSHRPLAIVCDMNGSARCLSIDSSFLQECGISSLRINDTAGSIVHAIIPEPENLVYCAQEMTRLHSIGRTDVLLGYMPDCDGDRGNIVYWNERESRAEVLQAQDVFALSVMAELAWLSYTNTTGPIAVAVNDPTSMRIEDIAAAFGARVHRAEVGEANVVNCARELREGGYHVRILGEGSNGGNITHPAAVRDPLNTLFAIIKLLSIRTTAGCKGLFNIWCEKAGKMNEYLDDFTLADIMATLPKYCTTGVSEERAILAIKTKNHADLKRSYQTVFTAAYERDAHIFESWNVHSWRAVCNNGTKQTDDITDFGLSGKGGLKILFYSDSGMTKPDSFIWMRGSGTEPVFRVMCDVKGGSDKSKQKEHDLLAWHTSLIMQSDEICSKTSAT